MKTRTIVRAGLAAFLALAAVSCGDDGPDSPDAAAPAAAQLAAGESATGASAAAASSSDVEPGDTVEFVASEFMFNPSTVVAEAGTYSGVLVNDGDIEHDILSGIYRIRKSFVVFLPIVKRGSRHPTLSQ